MVENGFRMNADERDILMYRIYVSYLCIAVAFSNDKRTCLLIAVTAVTVTVWLLGIRPDS